MSPAQTPNAPIRNSRFSLFSFFPAGRQVAMPRYSRIFHPNSHEQRLAAFFIRSSSILDRRRCYEITRCCPVRVHASPLIITKERPIDLRTSKLSASCLSPLTYRRSICQEKNTHAARLSFGTDQAIKLIKPRSGIVVARTHASHAKRLSLKPKCFFSRNIRAD
jgi:hypothetical protein